MVHCGWYDVFDVAVWSGMHDRIHVGCCLMRGCVPCLRWVILDDNCR